MLSQQISTIFSSDLTLAQTFEQKAASEHKTITSLIEDKHGLARELFPISFLQGSYKQDTAIYTINDVDIVVLCKLWYPGSGSGRSWSRDEIFDTISAPLLNDKRYKDKVRYNSGSMCIKVDLGIKIEILPVVYRAGNYDPQKEPFRLYRSENSQWEDGYARYHQAWLTWKNDANRTAGNFKPAIKVLKHLRSKFSLDAASFYIECLLFSLPDYLFLGSPADYIPSVLTCIANVPALIWFNNGLKTPCGERNIFVASEWNLVSWGTFHKSVVQWAKCAGLANQAMDETLAIRAWQLLLGEDFFPKRVSS